MKKLLFCLLVLSLLVFGCAQKAPDVEPVAKDEPIVEEPEPVVEDEPTTEEEPMVEEEPEEVVMVMPEKVQKILDKADGRVSSMKYMYQDQTNKPEEWETWVKGLKMHVKLREMDNIKDDVWIDNIYIDIAARKAVGYCERAVMRCEDPNEPVQVNFNKYYRKTPMDWVGELSYAENEGQEQMSMRTVHKLVGFGEDQDEKITMFVDDYYGIPSVVRVTKNGATNEYIYEDIAFNSVEDSDLEHGTITKTYK